MATTNENETAVALNAERANDAEQAMIAYRRVKEPRTSDWMDRYTQDMQDWLTDILADLRHWARANALNFDESAESSANHFAAEVGEELELEEESHD